MTTNNQYKYCFSSDIEHYSDNMRLICGILSKQGFNSKLSLIEDTDFDYISDKPLDEETIAMIKTLPGIEEVVRKK